MNPSSKIYIAGHTGLVGSAILRKLAAEGYSNIITIPHHQLDLCNQKETALFFEKEKPNYVFMAAAKVGGVAALEKYCADVIHDNIAMQMNVLYSAYKSGVTKLMFMGSNCIYPKFTEQPIKEEYMLTGKLEPTTEYYAIAKIAGIRTCQAYRKQYGCNFITILPVNLYGENDNYDLETAHVMPALLSKFQMAVTNKSSSVEIWGSGLPRREFLHSDDLADACLFLMLSYNEDEPINIGAGEDISIRDLALLIKEISGYEGELVFNASRPDGVISKVLDVSKIHSLGWHHKIELREGITDIYSKIYPKNEN